MPQRRRQSQQRTRKRTTRRSPRAPAARLRADMLYADKTNNSTSFLEGGRNDILPITIRPKTFTLQQTVNLGTINSTATPGTEFDGAYYFYLNQLSGVTGLGAVWDQYKFIQVTLNFQPVFSQLSFTSASGGVAGNFITALDYDDATSTTYSMLEQYDTAHHTPAYVAQSRTLTPRLAVAVYAGAFTSFANQRSWLDINSPSVQHYGVKYACTNNNSAVATTIYNVIALYTVAFRAVR